MLDLSIILETQSTLISALSSPTYVDVYVKQSAEIVTFVFISCEGLIRRRLSVRQSNIIEF